jgi:hypothetical protein
MIGVCKRRCGFCWRRSSGGLVMTNMARSSRPQQCRTSLFHACYPPMRSVAAWCMGCRVENIHFTSSTNFRANSGSDLVGYRRAECPSFQSANQPSLSLPIRIDNAQKYTNVLVAEKKRAVHQEYGYRTMLSTCGVRVGRNRRM